MYQSKTAPEVTSSRDVAMMVGERLLNKRRETKRLDKMQVYSREMTSKSSHDYSVTAESSPVLTESTMHLQCDSMEFNDEVSSANMDADLNSHYS